jgi:transcriptional antiterminator RfaH
MPWAAVQLQLHRDQLALRLLHQNGFETYAPRLCERRTVRGRRVEKVSLLFPNYAFVAIVTQWYQARWTPGVLRIVMDGATPAIVPDGVIGELRAREVNGLIELPVPPKFHRGDRVRICRGAFLNPVGLVAGLKPGERIEILLSLLGAPQRVTLPADALEPVVLS